MSAAKGQLQTAYEQLPAAMDKLNQAQKQVVGVEEEIVHLRKEAIARSVDKAMVQRFVSAALQMVDGVAKSLPVGQPFLGLAGSTFGAAAKIDWTAKKPLETAGAAVDHLSEQVDTFVTKKSEDVAMYVTRKRRGMKLDAEDLVTKLTNEQELAAREPAQAVAQVELTWRNFKSEEHKRLEEKINSTVETINKIKEEKTTATVRPDSPAVRLEFLAGPAETEGGDKPEGRAVALTAAPLQKELTEYRKRQLELTNAAEKVARIKNAKLKALAETPKHLLPPTVADKLAAATRQSEDQKRSRIARTEETATDTMASSRAGHRARLRRQCRRRMATPVSDDDPDGAAAGRRAAGERSGAARGRAAPSREAQGAPARSSRRRRTSCAGSNRRRRASPR